MRKDIEAGLRPRIAILPIAIQSALRRTAPTRARALTPSLLALSALSVCAALPAPAGAQEPDAQGPALDEIVVTGSRILRRDYESNSPIVTVNSDDFETQTGLNVEA